MDYTTISLAEARREYLATSTTAMAIAGFIAWAALAIGYAVLPDRMPGYAPFIAAAIPFPMALIIDKLRGEPGIRPEARRNPVTQMFMQFITVVAMLIPIVIIAAMAMEDVAFLVLGLAILAGLVWVPHGWGADDKAGFVHFVMRAVGCYAAYLFAPEPWKPAAIAGVAAATYIYAIAAMRKPASVR